MSDHDCTGCWQYDPERDREECLVCGAVRAPEIVPDGGQIACPACGHTFSAPAPYENGKGTYCPECGHGFAHGHPVADGGDDTCGRCGGSGQVTKMVAGCSGVVPCPDCDTVPEYALPDEVPDDPVARLEQIDQRLQDLQRERESWQEARRQVGTAQEALREVAAHDRVDDATAERLSFIRTMIDTVLHGVDVGRAIQYEREQLHEERCELTTYLEHVDGDDEPELVPDGGQLVSEPDADLDALQRVSCVECGCELPLSETARFARVGELDSGWLCEQCDEQLCELCDGRGRVRFPIAGTFDCPECEGGDRA